MRHRVPHNPAALPGSRPRKRGIPRVSASVTSSDRTETGAARPCLGDSLSSEQNCRHNEACRSLILSLMMLRDFAWRTAAAQCFIPWGLQLFDPVI